MLRVLPLAILLFVSPVLADQANRPRQKCPGGSESFGAPPPEGKQVWCRRPVAGGFIRQGPYSAYHRNGEKRMTGNFENNKPHGKWTSYDRHGKKTRERYFFDGKPYKEVRFDKNGKPYDYDEKKARAEKKRKKLNLNDWSGKSQVNQQPQGDSLQGFR